jgi:hypothetical protein
MRRSALALPLAACVGLLAWAVWPRGPALVLYTSPPITLDKKTFRLQALVPAEWTDGRRCVDQPDHYYHGPVDEHAQLFVFTLLPVKRPCAWLPAWLRSRLFAPPETRAGIAIIAETSRHSIDFFEVIRQGDLGPAGTTERWVAREDFFALRSFDSSGKVGVAYRRHNRSAFESTYRKICESFRVIPGDGK